MGKKLDLHGKVIGNLTVIGYSHTNKHCFWDVKCDCGTYFKLPSNKLNGGVTKSCGCLRKKVITKHNQWGTSIYKAWSMLVQRCININYHCYIDYGGRGITVCDKWLTFEGFYEDMGDKPKGTSIDRIDNNGNYCKENCRWATNKEQQNNKRNNVNITYESKTQTLAQWALELGIGRSTLEKRIEKMGWSVEKAFTNPIRSKKGVVSH